MRKVISMMVTATIIATFIGCSKNNNNNEEIQKVSNSEYTYELNSSPDLAAAYDTLSDITKDSEIIVEGKVIETKGVAFENSVVTKFKMEITESFKDNETAGTTVDLVSAGGIVLVDDYLKSNPQEKKSFEINSFKKLSSNEKKTQKIKYTLSNFPLIEKNKEYVFFGKKDHLASGETVYVPLGAVQGIFEIDGNNKVKSFARYGKEIGTLNDSKDDFKNQIIKLMNVQ